MTSLFSYHRLQSNSIYIGKNFGMISVVSDGADNEEVENDTEDNSNESDAGYCKSIRTKNQKYLKVSIQSIDGIGSRKSIIASTNHSTVEVLSFNRTITPLAGRLHNCVNSNSIVSIEYPDFYSFPAYLSVLFISLLLYVARFVFGTKRNSLNWISSCKWSFYLRHFNCWKRKLLSVTWWQEHSICKFPFFYWHNIEVSYIINIWRMPFINRHHLTDTFNIIWPNQIW